MLLLIALAYLAAAALFYILVAKLAPVRDEPVWFYTAPQRSAQIIDLFTQSRRRAA